MSLVIAQFIGGAALSTSTATVLALVPKARHARARIDVDRGLTPRAGKRQVMLLTKTRREILLMLLR
jgi:hypothetical protein